MKLWMRWVNFQALREILLLVEEHPGLLRAKDLTELTTERTILLGNKGQALGSTSHYHHRRTLERLGLLTKRNDRYLLNEQIPETHVLTTDKSFKKKLDSKEKEAFSNVILRNEDCHEVFFKKFLQSENPAQSTEEFIVRAKPVELRAIQSKRGVRRHRATPRRTKENEEQSYVAIREYDAEEWCTIPGINAVQAIHFGLRAWCVDQLNVLDDLYRSGAAYVIYPKHITPRLSTDELSTRMLNSLAFKDEWATLRVGNFALDVGIKEHVSINQAKEVLSSWLTNYPDLVEGIPTNERFITDGTTAGQRKVTFKGFIRQPGGAYLSHFQIHRNIHTRIKRKTT